MKFVNVYAAAVLFIVLPQLGYAQTLYYDTNGSTPGTSASSTQNFTDLVWTTDSTGSIATVGYTPGSDVVFSAGTNGTGTQSVTVTDTESADSFTFDNGIVTLFGSGAPNLSIGAGGIAVNSTDGATTFDSSLGTVTVSASQSWDNNSTQALNVNSGVTSSGSTLTFAGTGAGNTVLNGPLSGSLNLVQNSTTSRLYLTNNSSNFNGTITANGGSVVLDNFLNSNNTIDLNNGGTLNLNNTANYAPWNNNIVLGTGGGQFFAGDQATGGVDIVYGGVITGGTGLNFLGGDLLPNSNTASDVGTLNIKGGRVLAFGDGIFGNNAVVNVSSGATLDFQLNETLGNAIDLANGSALENRSGNIILSNVVFPTTGTVTLGSDDVGYGSLSISSDINLAGALTLNMNGTNGGTPVYLNGQISGSSPLVVSGAGNGSTPLVLNGNNDYSGPTTLNNVVVYPEGNGFGSSQVTMNNASINLTGGTFSNTFISNAGGFNLIAGAGTQSLTGTVHVAQSQSYVFFDNYSSSNLYVGNITFDTVQNSDRTANIDAYGSGAIHFDGTYISPAVSTGGSNTNGGYGASTLFIGYFSQNSSAQYWIDPSADLSQMEPFDVDGKAPIWMFAGTLNLENSSFVPGQTIALSPNNANVTETVNVVGSQNINASIYTSFNPLFTIAQATADNSNWNGVIQGDGGEIVLSAADGGRLNVTGDLNGYYSTVVKTGAGTVVLANPSGNDYQSGGGVAADIQQGTLLVSNPTGSRSAFSNSSGTVQIEAGATLGGNGLITQMVVAMDPTSVIAPGDAGQKNLGINPSIGILNLNTPSSGITANSGVTLNFKLDGDDIFPTAGTDNDLILANTLTLNGPVTINITALDALSVGFPYELITGNGEWDGSVNPTFTFNLPAGYALDPSYGAYDPNTGLTTQGYIFDNGYDEYDYFSIQLIAVPEPATYALIGFGLLSLLAGARLRKLFA